MEEKKKKNNNKGFGSGLNMHIKEVNVSVIWEEAVISLLPNKC